MFKLNESSAAISQTENGKFGLKQTLQLRIIYLMKDMSTEI